MATTYISNAFSLQMVDAPSKLDVVAVSPATVAEALTNAGPDMVSVMGHPDTARVVSGMLGMDIPTNRVSVQMHAGDVLYVAQVVGGRLPEGCTALPEGTRIEFRRVQVVDGPLRLGAAL